MPLAMNVGGMYTLPIFTAFPETPLLGVYTTRDEFWRGAHPFNIHRVPLYPLFRGLYPWL